VASKLTKGTGEPVFHRGEVARILGVTPLTMSNRERAGRYPPPRRDLNGYRVYNLNEVMNLQLLTYNMVDPRPIASLLFDRGWRDPKSVSQLLDAALARRVRT
jgi:hypothetical protein